MAMLPLSLPSYRPSGVLAIKQIAAHFKLPADTRDLAVQLFDQLLTSQTQESMLHYSELHKEHYIKLAVITAVIIASKMLDVGALRADQFSFEVSPPQQNAFEVYFLSCIRFDIDAFNTPSHWVRRLVPAWLGEAADITCSIFIERVAEELIGKFIEVDESRQFSAHAIATIAILLVLGQKQILLLPLPSALINVANISVRALLAGFNAFAVEFVLQAPHYMKADTKLSTLAARNLEMDKCLKVFELITFRRPTTPCSSFPTCMDSPVSITCTATLESSVLPTTAPPLFSPTFLPEDHILGHKRRPRADSFPFKRRLSFGEQQDL